MDIFLIVIKKEFQERIVCIWSWTMSVLPNLDFLQSQGLKKIKRSSFCLSLTAAGIRGSEYLEDREDFLNVFFKIVCKSFMGALSFLNFEVNGDKNFRTIGFVNIFCFCPDPFKNFSMSKTSNTSLEVCFQEGYFKI